MRVDDMNENNRMLLYKRIVYEGCKGLMREMITGKLQRAICIEATGIEEMLYYRTRNTKTIYAPKQDLCPPFNVSWIEWKPDAENAVRRGILVSWDTKKTKKGAVLFYEYEALCIEESRIEGKGGTIPNCLGRVIFRVTRTGNAVGDEKQGCVALPVGGRRLTALHVNLLAVYNAIVRESIRFLNAKNVELEAQPFGRKDNARMNRNLNTKNVGYKFHTIVVRKAGSKRILYANKTGAKMPLHLVRGHYRTYDKKGMFGKIFGTFFIPCHTCGSEQYGVVDKDYQLDDGT